MREQAYEQFTFHYGSIQMQLLTLNTKEDIDLHSTMVLFKFVSLGVRVPFT